MDLALLLIRLFLFGVFSVAAIGKLLDPEGSERAMRDFGVSEGLSKPAAWLLPFAELSIAAGLLFTSTSWYASLAATMLLAIFTSGMLVQIAKGKSANCHCFGQMHSEPVSKKSVFRNVFFLALAVVPAVSGVAGQGYVIGSTTPETLQSAILLFIAAGIVAALLHLRLVLTGQSDITRRLNIMEAISHDGTAVEREDVGDPHDSLPIGAPMPDFALADLNGRTVAFDHLLMKGKPMLFMFIGPTCEPCKALLPELKAWKFGLKDKLEIVFISTGKAVENREKFGAELADSILLQPKRELSELVHAKWTPTAILVAADGTIISRPAVGDTAIRTMVEKLKGEDMSRPQFYYGEGNFHNHGATTRIGESVPDFALADLEGRNIGRSFFEGKKTLVAFWSLTCPHCQGMVESLRRWEKEKAEHEPQLIMFSEGDADEHRRFELPVPILLEDKYATAQKFGMYGTPSAVLVDETGHIVSETAIGTANIWALLGKDQ